MICGATNTHIQVFKIIPFTFIEDCRKLNIDELQSMNYFVLVSLSDLTYTARQHYYLFTLFKQIINHHKIQEV